MSTKREQIIVALLGAVDGISGLPTFRSRAIPFAKGTSPALVLEPIQDVAEEETVHGAPLTWNLQVRLTIIIRDDAGPDSAADTYIEQVHEAIVADRKLGGLCMDIMPLSVNYEIIDADTTLGLIALDFRVTYRTAFNSLN